MGSFFSFLCYSLPIFYVYLAYFLSRYKGNIFCLILPHISFRCLYYHIQLSHNPTLGQNIVSRFLGYGLICQCLFPALLILHWDWLVRLVHIQPNKLLCCYQVIERTIPHLAKATISSTRINTFISEFLSDYLFACILRIISTNPNLLNW